MKMHHETAAAGRAAATILTLVAVTALASMSARAAAPPGDESASARAQSGSNLEKPSTWKVRYDDGEVGERSYEVMRPGWHVHPGPAGIFWDPGRFAADNYSVTSTIFLFPAGQGEPPSQVAAPYGLLLAGENLEGVGATYVSFMLRNDGSFRVARHSGPETREIVPWTTHDSVLTWTESIEGTAKNILTVDATAESVTFLINDQIAALLDRTDMPLDGVVGIRAGAGLSLHISEIAIGPNRR